MSRGEREGPAGIVARSVALGVAAAPPGVMSIRAGADPASLVVLVVLAAAGVACCAGAGLAARWRWGLLSVVSLVAALLLGRQVGLSMGLALVLLVLLGDRGERSRGGVDLDVAGPLVGAAVAAALWRGAGPELVVQMVAVLVATSGRARRLVGGLGGGLRRSIDAAGRLLLDVVFSLVSVALLLVPWMVHRVGRTDPLVRSDVIGWHALTRGPGRPHSQWRPETVERPGVVWTVRRTVAPVALVVAAAVVVVPWLARLRGDEMAARTSSEAPPPAVADDAWWPQYAETMRWLNTPGLGQAYDPFGPFRVADVRSAHINVADGQRRTWSPDCGGCRKVVVWLYGGSTTFGIGQRDEHTIASELARLAWRDGVALDVRNRGVPADMHWEEAERFAWDVASEPLPDLVLFYDGTNEMWASLVLNGQGMGADESRWNPETVSASELYRAAVTGMEGVSRGRPPRGAALTEPDRAPDERLPPEQVATHVLARYATSVAMSSATARANDVDAVWFWQPCDRVPSTIRGESGSGQVGRDRARLCAATVDGLPDGVVDLSGALDQREQPTYLDGMHTNEAGARMAAAAVYRHVATRVRDVARSYGQ